MNDDEDTYNYESSTLNEKYYEYSKYLVNIENDIVKFENKMYKNWDYNYPNILMDKYDYYEYVLKNDEYANLINIKNSFQLYLNNLLEKIEKIEKIKESKESEEY